MFSPQFATAAGRANPMAHAYRVIGAETAVSGATPHRLVVMLFEGYMEALAQARGALQSGQIELKGRALSRAARIVDEGLRAALNLEEGGELAADLHALYGYLVTRLTLANLRNDPKMIDECQALMVPLRDAWLDIGPRVGAPR